MNELLKIYEELKKNSNIELLEEQENGVIVLDEISARNALSMALQSRKLVSVIEESRKVLVKPHIDYQTSINLIIRDFKEKLEKIENRLQEKIEIWMKKENENPFSAISQIKVEDGSLSQRYFWEFEIENEELIPEEYYSYNIDENKIRASISLGFRDIPGVKFYQEKRTQLRVKN